MSPSFPYPSDELIYRLGWMLIHTLWLGAATAALFAAAMAALRRRSARLRYVVGCVALVALMASAIAAFVLSTPPARPAPHVAAKLTAASPEGAVAANTDAASYSPLTAVSVRPINLEHGASPIHAEHPGAVAAAPDTSSATQQEPPLLARAAQALEPALPWLVLAWTVGVCILALWQLAGWIAAQRLKRLSVRSADEGLVALVGRLAGRLDVQRAVKLLESALVRVPTVIGWLRPVILLPLGFATGLTPAQVESILVHELSHIRRYDYLVNLLQSLVETLLFYHPATWYISRRIRTEREHCCDDLTLAFGVNQRSYAQSLLHLAQQSKALDRRGLAPAGMTATGKPSELRSRVGRVLGAKDETSRLGRSWPVVLCVLIVLVGISLFAASCMNSTGRTTADQVAAKDGAGKTDAFVELQVLPESRQGFRLQTGESVEAPHSDVKPPKAWIDDLVQWSRKESVDVVSGDWNGLIALWPIDAVTACVDNCCWDRFDAAEALKALSGAQQTVMVADGQLPRTYVLRTREGRLAVLQFAGLQTSPRAAKVRYRMHSGQLAVASATQPATQPAWQNALIPDEDTKDAPVVLDLASGKLLPAPPKGRVLGYFAQMHQGDLGFDRVLFTLRGGVLLGPDGKPLTPKAIKGDSSAYDVSTLPQQVVVRTPEGAYRLQIVAVTDNGGIHVRFVPTSAPATRPATGKAAEAASKQRKVEGRVVDADGKGVADAEVLVVRIGPWYSGIKYTSGQEIVERTRTDADGKFSVVGDEGPIGRCVIARKRDVGFGYNWTITNLTRPDHYPYPRELRLHKAANLEGVVVDEAGQPVANAQVQANLFLDVDSYDPNVLGCGDLDWFTARTGKDGRFMIPGVPADMMAEFVVRAAGMGTVATHGGKAPQYKAGQEDIRIVLPRQCRIEGTAVDVSTGKPVAGAKLIGIRKPSAGSSTTVPPVFTVTDKNGRFVMESLQPGGWTVALAQQCMLEHGDPGEWVAWPATVDLASEKPQSIQVELSHGETVEVALVNAATGAPIRGRLFAWHFASQLSDDKGIVQMRLLPGDYKLYATDYPDPVVWQGQTAPRRYHAEMPLTVEQGKSQQIQLRLMQEPATQPASQPATQSGQSDVRPVQLSGLQQEAYGGGIASAVIYARGKADRKDKDYLDLATSGDGGCVVAGRIVDIDRPDKNAAVSLFFVSADTARFTVCETPVSGEFRVKNLPAGRYRVLALEKSGDQKTGKVGVGANWEIIKVAADKPIENLDVVLSNTLTKDVSDLIQWNRGLTRLELPDLMTGKTGPFGKVVDASGQPVMGSMVQIREFKENRGIGEGIAAPDTISGVNGFYGMKQLDYPYTVTANVCTPLQDGSGMRWQTLSRMKVFEGRQRVDFVMPPWPGEGKNGGTVTLHVVGPNGKPVTDVIARISLGKQWPKSSANMDGWYSEWGLKVELRDGKAVVKEVPAGECTVRFNGKNLSPEAQLQGQVIKVVPGANVNVEIKTDWPTTQPAS